MCARLWEKKPREGHRQVKGRERTQKAREGSAGEGGQWEADSGKARDAGTKPGLQGEARPTEREGGRQGQLTEALSPSSAGFSV